MTGSIVKIQVADKIKVNDKTSQGGHSVKYLTTSCVHGGKNSVMLGYSNKDIYVWC